ncbi:hypothetical protein ACHAWF_005471, partial [Thalassiosira exigua]
TQDAVENAAKRVLYGHIHERSKLLARPTGSKKLKPFVACYIRNSHDFLEKLKQLRRLSQNDKLFTADAVPMYTNIDADHAINVIGSLKDSERLPDGFPLDEVKEVMTLVMCNNLFKWGDCYFLQFLGTTMGTSAAC